MKGPPVDVVRCFGSRLGFGSPETSDEIAPVVCVKPAPLAGHQVPAKIFNLQGISSGYLESTGDLIRLVEQVEADQQQVPAAAEPVTPEPAPSAWSAKKTPLEGLRAVAIGFPGQHLTRLDKIITAELASAEFIPQWHVGDTARLRGVGLLIVHIASGEILLRDQEMYRSMLSLGIPAIVAGNRSVLDAMHTFQTASRWDFLGYPWHGGELIWRAVRLLTPPGASQPVILPGTLRAVIADHDPIARALAESAFTQRGIECTGVQDGDAAWALVESTSPDVLVVDLTLPNRDGLQLLADIKRNKELRTKVLILSARQAETDILRAFSLGADDYVTKPFSPLELAARVQRLVRVS